MAEANGRGDFNATVSIWKTLWAEAVQAENDRDRAVQALWLSLRPGSQLPAVDENTDKKTTVVHGHVVPGAASRFDEPKDPHESPTTLAAALKTLPDRAFNWGATKYTVLHLAKTACTKKDGSDYTQGYMTINTHFLSDAIIAVGTDLRKASEEFRSTNFSERPHPKGELPSRGVTPVAVPAVDDMVAAVQVNPLASDVSAVVQTSSQAESFHLDFKDVAMPSEAVPSESVMDNLRWPDDEFKTGYDVYELAKKHKGQAQQDSKERYWADAEEALEAAFLKRVNACPPPHRLQHDLLAFPKEPGGGEHKLILNAVSGLDTPSTPVDHGYALVNKSPDSEIGPGGYHVQWGFDVGTGYGEGGYDAWEMRIPSTDPACPVKKDGTDRGGYAYYAKPSPAENRGVGTFKQNENVRLKGIESYKLEHEVRARGLHEIHAKDSSLHPHRGAPYVHSFQPTCCSISEVCFGASRYFAKDSIARIGGERCYFPYSRLLGPGLARGNQAVQEDPKENKIRITRQQLKMMKSATDRLDSAVQHSPGEEDGGYSTEESEGGQTSMATNSLFPGLVASIGAEKSDLRPNMKQSERKKQKKERPAQNNKRKTAKPNDESRSKRGKGGQGASVVDRLMHFTPVFGIVQDYDARAIALRKSQEEWTKFVQKYPSYTAHKDRYEELNGQLVETGFVTLSDLRTNETKRIRFGDPDCFIHRYYRKPSSYKQSGTWAYDDGPPDADPLIAGWRRPAGRYPSSWFQDISDHSRPKVASDKSNPYSQLEARADAFEKMYKKLTDSKREHQGVLRIENEVIKCEEELSKHAAVLTWMDCVLSSSSDILHQGDTDDNTKIKSYPFTSTAMEGIIFVRDALLHVEQMDRCFVTLKRLQMEAIRLDSSFIQSRAAANMIRDLHTSHNRPYTHERLRSLKDFAGRFVEQLTILQKADEYELDDLDMRHLNLKRIDIAIPRADLAPPTIQTLHLPARLVDVVEIGIKSKSSAELQFLKAALANLVGEMFDAKDEMYYTMEEAALEEMDSDDEDTPAAPAAPAAPSKRYIRDIFSKKALRAVDLIAKAFFGFIETVAHGNYRTDQRRVELAQRTMVKTAIQHHMTFNSGLGMFYVGEAGDVYIEVRQETKTPLPFGDRHVLMYMLDSNLLPLAVDQSCSAVHRYWTRSVPMTVERKDLLAIERTEEAFLASATPVGKEDHRELQALAEKMGLTLDLDPDGKLVVNTNDLGDDEEVVNTNDLGDDEELAIRMANYNADLIIEKKMKKATKQLEEQYLQIPALKWDNTKDDIPSLSQRDEKLYPAERTPEVLDNMKEDARKKQATYDTLLNDYKNRLNAMFDESTARLTQAAEDSMLDAGENYQESLDVQFHADAQREEDIDIVNAYTERAKEELYAVYRQVNLHVSLNTEIDLEVPTPFVQVKSDTRQVEETLWQSMSDETVWWTPIEEMTVDVVPPGPGEEQSGRGRAGKRLKYTAKGKRIYPGIWCQKHADAESGDDSAGPLLSEENKKHVSRALDQYFIGETYRKDNLEFVERHHLVEFVVNIRGLLTAADVQPQRGLGYKQLLRNDDPEFRGRVGPQASPENLIPEHQSGHLRRVGDTWVIWTATAGGPFKMVATDQDGVPDLWLRMGRTPNDAYDWKAVAPGGNNAWKYTSVDDSNGDELTPHDHQQVKTALETFRKELFCRKARRLAATVNDPRGRMTQKGQLVRFMSRNGLIRKDRPEWVQGDHDGWSFKIANDAHLVWDNANLFDRLYAKVEMAAANLERYRTFMVEWAEQRLIKVQNKRGQALNILTAPSTVPGREVDLVPTWSDPVREKLTRQAEAAIAVVEQQKRNWTSGNGRFGGTMVNYRAELAVMIPIVSDSLFSNEVSRTTLTKPQGVSSSPEKRAHDAAFFMSIIEGVNIFHEDVRFIHHLLYGKPFHHLVSRRQEIHGRYTKTEYENAMGLPTLQRKVARDLARLNKAGGLTDSRVARKAKNVMDDRDDLVRKIKTLFGNEDTVDFSQQDATLVMSRNNRDLMTRVMNFIGIQWSDFGFGTAPLLDQMLKISGLRQKFDELAKQVKVDEEEKLKKTAPVQQPPADSRDTAIPFDAMDDPVVDGSFETKRRLKRMKLLVDMAASVRDVLQKGVLMHAAPTLQDLQTWIDVNTVTTEAEQKKEQQEAMQEYLDTARFRLAKMTSTPPEETDEVLTAAYHSTLAKRAARNSKIGYISSERELIWDNQMDPDMVGFPTKMPMGGHERFPFETGQGWMAPTDEQIRRQSGNGYDGQQGVERMVFTGSEIFGPKGAYIRYLVDTCSLNPKSHIKSEKELWEADQTDKKFKSVKSVFNLPSVDRHDLSIVARNMDRLGGAVDAHTVINTKEYRMGPALVPMSYWEFLHGPMGIIAGKNK